MSANEKPSPDLPAAPATGPTMAALAERKPTVTALAVSSIVPRSVEELSRLASILYLGGLGAKAGASRPEAVAAIILSGLEIGLKPGQALSSIYLQGGRATLYGAMPLAMVRSSGLLEYFEERIEGDGESRTATCTAKRRGDSSPPRVQRFSIADARRAGLLDRAADKGKGAGAWLAWQDRMLTFRARTPVLQDLFGDVLAGFELEDDRPTEAETRPATVTRATVTMDTSLSAPGGGGGAEGENREPPTDAHGELMVDDDTIRKITGLMGGWVALYGPNPCPTPADGVRAWRAMLSQTFGVESAKNLTAAQAEQLLALLAECQANPTAAVFAPPTVATDTATADQQQQQPEPATAAA